MRNGIDFDNIDSFTVQIRPFYPLKPKLSIEEVMQVQ